MMIRRTAITVLIGMSSISCGDSPKDQQVAALTFNGLSVAQMSDVVIESGDVNHPPPFAATDRRHEWNLSAVGRSTAELVVERCTYSGAELGRQLACSICGDADTARGTATLTSPTRLLTAHHNIGFKSRRIDATFGHDLFHPDRSRPNEESWFFPQRLYSLGLSDLAHAGAEEARRRQNMKQWQFEAERRYYDESTRTGRDVAVLVPFAKVFFSAVAGNFAVMGPGPFFDSVPLAARDSQRPRATEEVFGNMFVQVPFDPFLRNRLDTSLIRNRLLARDAFFGEAPFFGSSDDTSCVQPSNLSRATDWLGCAFDGNAFVRHEPNYSDCLSTSLDSVSGSSGGSAVVLRTEEGEPETRLRVVGVHHASVGALTDIEQQWAFDAAQQYPDAQRFQKISLLSNAIHEDASNDYNYSTTVTSTSVPRGVSFEELNSSPYFQPGSDIPEGCDLLTNPKCTGAGGGFGRAGPGGAGSAGGVGAEDGRSMELENLGVIQSATCMEMYGRGYPGYEDARLNTGYAIGLTGSPSISDADSDSSDAIDPALFPTLSSIGVVCAPWSAASWMFNWGDLITAVEVRAQERVSYFPAEWRRFFDGRASFPGSFSKLLGNAFAIRESSTWQSLQFAHNSSPTAGRWGMQRPAHFQLCPPGYAMNGVRVATRACVEEVDGCSALADAKDVVRSVADLFCVPVPYPTGVPAEDVEISIPLKGALVHDFTFGGERVRLENELGATDFQTSDEFRDLRCPDGRGIGGLETENGQWSTVQTTFLQFPCVDLPDRGGTATRSLGLDADTYVLKNEQRNFGSELEMLLGGGRSARLLLKADLDAVEQAIGEGTITRVVLEFPFGGDADEEISVRLHRMTQEWTELGATWGCASLEPDGSCSATWNLFEHPGQGNGVGHGRDRSFPDNPWIDEPTATLVVDGESQASFQVDVTADVKAMIAGGGTNYGWILISDSRPNVETSLKTRESGDGAQLIVEFDPVLPEATLKLSPNDVFLRVSDGISFTSPEPAASWYVNGIEGGNASVGFVSSSGVYTAPPAPPSLATVQVAGLTTTGEVADAHVTVARRTVDPALGEARHTFYGADANDGTGDGVVAPRNSVASGDLDADGIDDIVIGVPGSDGFGNVRPNAGEVAVYFGSSALGPTVDMRTQPPNIVVWGAGLADRPLGSSIAIADLDGDGHDDLIISDVSAGQNSSGLVHVFFGPFAASQSIDLLTDDADLTILAPVGGDAFGWRLAAGDVDGDGIADLVAEARLRDGPNGRTDAGALYVISGAPTLKTAGVLDLAVQPPRSTIFLPPVDGTMPADAPPLALAFAKRLEGAPLSVGDLTGDGIADIVVGRNSAETFGGPPMAGSVLVLFGGPQLAQVVDLGTTSADATFYGASALDMLGVSTVVSDVTADGFGDLIATAPGLDGAGRTNAGGAWIVEGPVVAGTFELGGAASAAGAIRVVGPRTDGLAGYSVAVAQLDSDAHVEIALSGCISFTGAVGACGPASERDFAGEVYVFDLANASSIVDLRATPMDLVTFGADPFDRFGASLYRADTDGVVPDELVVGAPDADGPDGLRSGAGEVLVISAVP